MLNPFPSLLVYGFFAPTLLRVVAAGAFFYLATLHWRTREGVAHDLSGMLGRSTAGPAAAIFPLVEFLVAAGLLFGFWTQVAAIVGAVLCLKILFVKRGLRHLSPISHLSYILLGVICLSLLATGAGAFAFDLPL